LSKAQHIKAVMMGRFTLEPIALTRPTLNTGRSHKKSPAMRGFGVLAAIC
jgi:hypothetical protein